MRLSIIKNRTMLVGFSAAGGFALMAVVLILLAGMPGLAKADPGILYVAPGGVCGGAAPCYGNIQTAVDAANVNDEIRIAAGTYSAINNLGGLAQVLYIDKSVVVRGGYTTTDWDNADPQNNITTLDANGLGRVIYITGDISPTIEGLEIYRGDADGLGGDPWFGWDAGGGIYVISATATIKNNQIKNNTVDTYFGGGLYINSSNSIVSNNVIDSNFGGTGGGVGIWYSDAILDSNIISNNRHGGVWLYGYAPIFRNNTVIDNYSDQRGGGFALYYGGAIFEGNTIADNASDREGGGISLYTYSSSHFTDNRIYNNSAGQNGGGMDVRWHSRAVMTNTVLTDNEAGGDGSGVHLAASDLDSVQATIARNSNGDGKGVFVTGEEGIYSTAVLKNTIFSDHNVGIEVTGDNTLTVNSVLWHNTPVTIDAAPSAVVSLQNEYAGDPNFAADGYHLLSGSGAVDKGLNFGVDFDIDGEKRPSGAAPDLGADELTAKLEINHESGAQGSFFTLSCSYFPPNDTAAVSVNGVALGTVATDANGSCTFILDTKDSDEGFYYATATVNPSAGVSFTIDNNEPVHPQEGSGTILAVPAGIAFTDNLYLPVIIRK